MLAIKPSVVASMTVIDPPRPAAYRRVPAGFIAATNGPWQTAFVATTVLVDVSMTRTAFSTTSVTYTRSPAGATATPIEPTPTGILATILLAPTSITTS